MGGGVCMHTHPWEMSKAPALRLMWTLKNNGKVMLKMAIKKLFVRYPLNHYPASCRRVTFY